MTTTEISNSQDVIDSRDVIARIEEIKDELPDSASEVMPGTSDEIQELRDELQVLEALADEASGYAADWQYGETLIRNSYFTEYTEELCKDCGYIQTDGDNNFPWWIVIDWEATAQHVQQDYTSVDFDGVEYWIR